MPQTAFSFDDSQLRDFDRRLSAVGKAFDRATTSKVLRASVKPALEAVKQNAPVGPPRRYKSTVIVRGKRKGKGRNPVQLRRGGATRQDARILAVAGNGNEVAGVVVGISKRKGKVGFRTHFITRANLHNPHANDFIDKSERQSESQVLAGFGQAAEAVVAQIILRG